MARFAKRHLADGASILDIGCGVGANAFWLASEGYLVTAIDTSQEAINRLESRLYGMGDYDIGLNDYLVADATSLQFEKDAFDAAIDCCTLQHMADIGKALSEIHRVLKPGGQMFSVIASRGHSMSAFPGGIYVRLWSTDDLQAFADAGLKIEYFGFSHYDDEKYGSIAHWMVRARKV